MSKRTILSRPRTRVYDANYNIGESMYKPALDNLDRKYYGRTMSPPKRFTSIPSELLDRHERAFMDDDLDNCRRRAERYITGDSFFDSRGARLDARELMDSGFDEETVSRIKGIRATKKVSAIDDLDADNTLSSNISSRRILDRSEKLMDDNDYTPRSRRGLDEDVTVKRRSLRITATTTDDDDSGIGSREYKKWSSLKDDQNDGLDSGILLRSKQSKLRFNDSDDTGVSSRGKQSRLRLNDTEESTTGASTRVKQSRARLDDLEEEMEAMNERAAEREKRAARLRALIAEVAEEADIPLPTTSSSRRALRMKEQQEEEVAY